MRSYGEKWGVAGKQEEHNDRHNTKFGQTTQRSTRGSSSAGKEAKEVTRIPVGHPEG